MPNVAELAKTVKPSRLKAILSMLKQVGGKAVRAGTSKKALVPAALAGAGVGAYGIHKAKKERTARKRVQQGMVNQAALANYYRNILLRAMHKR